MMENLIARIDVTETEQGYQLEIVKNNVGCVGFVVAPSIAAGLEALARMIDDGDEPSLIPQMTEIKDRLRRLVE